MLICSLDPASRTGWSWGTSSVSCKPIYGAIKIKEPGESPLVAPVKIACFLRDLFEGRIDKLAEYPCTIPDLLVYEAPLNPHVWFQMCQKIGRPQNAESLTMQHTVAGAIEAICSEFGVQCEQVQRQEVVKHVTGKRTWSDHKGDTKAREKGKKAVIAQMKLLGYVPLTFNDDDVCDSLANLEYARAYWGRVAPAELQLFGQTA
jgi:hypothetical protein